MGYCSASGSAAASSSRHRTTGNKKVTPWFLHNAAVAVDVEIVGKLEKKAAGCKLWHPAFTLSGETWDLPVRWWQAPYQHPFDPGFFNEGKSLRAEK